MRNDSHLPANNVEDVGSVLPPLSQGLRQDNTSRPFGHQTHNGLRTHSTDISPSLLIQNGVPHQNLACTSPTEIWG